MYRHLVRSALFFCLCGSGSIVLADEIELLDPPGMCESLESPESPARAKAKTAHLDQAKKITDYWTHALDRKLLGWKDQFESKLWDLEYKVRLPPSGPRDALEVINTLPPEVKLMVFADWFALPTAPLTGPGAVSYGKRRRFARCVVRLLPEAELDNLYALGGKVPCGPHYRKVEDLFMELRKELPSFKKLVQTKRASEIDAALASRPGTKPRLVHVCNVYHPALEVGSDCRLRDACDQVDADLAACGVDVVRLDSPSLEQIRRLNDGKFSDETIMLVDSHGSNPKYGPHVLDQFPGVGLDPAELRQALPPGKWNLWTDACYSGAGASCKQRDGVKCGYACRADQTAAMKGYFSSVITELICRKKPAAVEAWKGLGPGDKLEGARLSQYFCNAVGTGSDGKPQHSEWRPTLTPKGEVGRERCTQNPILGDFGISARLYGPREAPPVGGPPQVPPQIPLAHD